VGKVWESTRKKTKTIVRRRKHKLVRGGESGVYPQKREKELEKSQKPEGGENLEASNQRGTVHGKDWLLGGGGASAE